MILIGTSLDLDDDGPLLAEQPARFDTTRSVIRPTPPPLTVAAAWWGRGEGGVRQLGSGGKPAGEVFDVSPVAGFFAVRRVLGWWVLDWRMSAMSSGYFRGAPPGPNPRAWVSPWPLLAGGYLTAPTVIGYKLGHTAAIRQAIFNV